MATVSEIYYLYQSLLYLWFNWLEICCMFLPPYSEYLFLLFIAGRLLDMHGAHGYIFR